jgi:hypothetical protein
MAKKRAKKEPEFKNGWRVIAYLPVPTRPGWTGTQRNMARVDGKVGVVEEAVTKMTRAGSESWVYVNIEGTSFLVPEPDIEHKTDEPYCADFVAEMQQASLVRKRVKQKDVYVERERIVTPNYEKGFLKPLRGAGWKHEGAPVNRLHATLLDETYKRLTTQAARAGS